MSKVGPIRRTIGFVCTAAMTVIGAYGLGDLLALGRLSAIE
jgi:hypothetical protein